MFTQFISEHKWMFVSDVMKYPPCLHVSVCSYRCTNLCVCCQVFACVSPPLPSLPFTALALRGLAAALRGERADGRIEELAGLPPCAVCEVAAKRLRTGRALSVRGKKMPRTENLSEIPRKECEEREKCVVEDTS